MQSVNNSFDFYSVLSSHLLLNTRSMHYSSLPLHLYLACSSIFSLRLFCTPQLNLCQKMGCIEVRLGCNARLVGPTTVHSSARQVTLQCKTSFGITVPVQLSRQAVPLTSGTLGRLKTWHPHMCDLRPTSSHLSTVRVTVTPALEASLCGCFRIPYSASCSTIRPGTCSRVSLDRPRATNKDLTGINESTNNTPRRWRPEIHKGRIRYVLAIADQ